MYAQSRQERAGSAALAAIVTAAMGWALLNGLAGDYVRRTVEQGLATFSVTPPPPPEQKTVPRPKVSKRAEGKAAPPNLRSKATPVAAPKPVIIVPVPPPPVVVAVKPFAGNQATQGAAERIGPGTGAGGTGNGTGSGGWGNGDGDGGDEIPPRWRKGRIGNSDFPRDIGETAARGFEGTVEVKFLVWTDGRVRDCAITRTSGYRVLDDTTCRLIQQRFRYEPSRDNAGRPVPAWIVEDHTWVVERNAANGG